MIFVEFVRRQDNLVSFDIKGHANYSDDFGGDRDMLCSAVSAVSLTIVNGISEIKKVKAPCEVHDGFLSMDISSLNEEDIFKCQDLLETMLLGLKSMEQNYGKYINVKVEEV